MLLSMLLQGFLHASDHPQTAPAEVELGQPKVDHAATCASHAGTPITLLTPDWLMTLAGACSYSCVIGALFGLWFVPALLRWRSEPIFIPSKAYPAGKTQGDLNSSCDHICGMRPQAWNQISCMLQHS